MSKPKKLSFKGRFSRLAMSAGAVLLATGLASAQPITTELNGSRLTFDQPPIMQDGRVLVPLRGIFESLGANVLYQPSNRTIKATEGSRTVELTLGQRQAFVDGRQMFLDVPANTIGGRTMVPLRFVSEALGADVKWQSATKTVAITQDTQVADNNQQNNQQPTANRPEVDQLIYSPRGTLAEGDTLTVTMVGAPNARASFSILGAINDVQMTEISNGRYQGQLRITRGMDVNRGTLVGRLEKNGAESILEASRPVTIATNTNNNGGDSTIAYVQPTPGTSVSQSRPMLTAQFTEPVRAGTATISVNGVNYTPGVSNDSRTLTYVPNYDLSPGTYQVQAQALANDGRLLTKSWNFIVDSNTVGQSGQPTVSVNNLYDGASVPAVFNIQGQTTPYTKVKIGATENRSLIPGVIGIQGRTLQTSTVSDGNGHFDVQLNTSSLPSSSRIDLEVSVLGNNGQVTDSVDYNLIRQ